MQAPHSTPTLELPSVVPVDWDDGQPTIEWLKERRRALLSTLFREATRLGMTDAAFELHRVRVRALDQLDGVIEAYEITGHGEERCGSCGMSELCDCSVSIA